VTGEQIICGAGKEVIGGQLDQLRAVRPDQLRADWRGVDSDLSRRTNMTDARSIPHADFQVTCLGAEKPEGAVDVSFLAKLAFISSDYRLGHYTFYCVEHHPSWQRKLFVPALRSLSICLPIASIATQPL
jgi:hypothetical protein